MHNQRALIFWLILAATLSIDAVAFSCFNRTPWPNHANGFYEGLLLGQLSVVCIWSVLAAEKGPWTSIIPWLAALLAGLAHGFATSIATSSPIWPWLHPRLVQYMLHVAFLLPLLWLLKRSGFWRRRTHAPAIWQYSLSQLLILTTALAILVALWRNLPFNQAVDLSWGGLYFHFGPPVLALVSLLIWSHSSHPLLRGAATLFLSILAGMGYSYMTSRTWYVPFLITYHVIQGIVLSAWLYCAALITAPDASSYELLHLPQEQTA